MERWSLRFIRWGAGFLVFGLLTGYGPLEHYLMGGVKMRCPWAPVHAHVALLGWVGFTLFGLVYKALPDWGTPTASSIRLAAAHFWLAVVSVVGINLNGTFGYRWLNSISPSFYYRPDPATLNLWLSIDGGFLTLYGAGSILFIWVLLGVTAQSARKA